MKKVIRSVPFKILCYLVTAAALLVFCASLFGNYLLSSMDSELFRKDFAAYYHEFMQEKVEEYVLQPDTMAKTTDFASSYTEDGYLVDFNRGELVKQFSSLDFIVKKKADGATVISNLKITADEQAMDWDYVIEAVAFVNENGEIFFSQNRTDYSIYDNYGTMDCILLMKLSLGNSHWDEIRVWDFGLRALSRYAELTPGLLVGSASIFLLFLILLLCGAARRPDTEEIILGPIARIPTDLFLVLVVLFYFVTFRILVQKWEYSAFVRALIWSGIGICVMPAIAMNMATRVKADTLYSNTVLGYIQSNHDKLLAGLGNLGKSISSIFFLVPFPWKAVFACLLAFSGNLWIILRYRENPEKLVFGSVAWNVVLLFCAFYIIAQLRKLQNSAQHFAEGNLNQQVELTGMMGDFRKTAENMNSIANGMSVAVKEQVKSERMKTELITNVSHDIKTPLTSIINYAALVGECYDRPETVKEYSEVLLRQSERMKRLLEDLVEAAKLTSGTLDVNPEPCVAAVFLEQACGEFEDRLQKSQLTLVMECPENEIYILADGRRMWRIFDNLLSNICKYSQPGTRVYLSLTEEDEQAVFTFKNVSKCELNVSEEELMERFVRGDQSRTTEGNGLGLSIAKSLAELQGGLLKISIDGDLFKATLRFPSLSELDIAVIEEEKARKAEAGKESAEEKDSKDLSK